jgi:hypothetical protein
MTQDRANVVDRTASDEAIDLIAKSFSQNEDEVYEAIETTLSAFGYEPLFEHIVDALPAWLLRRLADRKDGGPLYEGELTPYQMAEHHLWDRRVVVYPARETTT